MIINLGVCFYPLTQAVLTRSEMKEISGEMGVNCVCCDERGDGEGGVE